MRITRVYTRSGDKGTTGLGGGQRVPKESLRIETYGTVDELNSVIGVALSSGVHPELTPILKNIQSELFRLGSDLCLLEEDKIRFKLEGMLEKHVTHLESLMDSWGETLKPLEEFILPGGTQASAQLHVARTVCRRAERHAVALSHQEEIGSFVVPYLNRLSDFLFVAARMENYLKGEADVFWDKTK